MGEEQFKQAKAGLSMGRAGRPAGACRTTAARVIGLLAVVLIVGDSAFADFLVQPMLLRKACTPGQRYPVELKLENVDPTVTEAVTLRLAELTQKSDGQSTEMLPNDPNLSKATLRSCRTWLTTSSAAIQVPPYKIVPFTMQIDVPPQTKGFYFAAIVATTAPRMKIIEGATLAPVNMEMVVPVILEVQSMPMQQKISLSAAGLEHRLARVDVPAASFATIDVTNAGGTFSRLQPVARVWGQAGGHWQKLAEVKFPDMTIMPGVKLHLKQDMGRLLASGTYRVEGFIYVDGRRGSRVQSDVSFKGDPGLPTDVLRKPVAVNVQPAPLFVESKAGATRSTSVQVMNGSEDDIIVDAELALPAHMGLAVNNRGVKGEDLGCANWVTASPARFTLKGYAKRGLSLLVRMPTESGKYPTYYATLKLRVSYADGQLAGTKETYVCIQNKQGAGEPAITPTVLSVSETSPSRYLATGIFLNGGETHVTPTCQGVLSMIGVGGGTGASILKRFLMSSEAYGQTGMMLPFESRSFSGVLDVSDVPPGEYYVTAVIKWPNSAADGLQNQKRITVVEQGGRKIIRMGELAGQQVVIKM